MSKSTRKNAKISKPVKVANIKETKKVQKLPIFENKKLKKIADDVAKINKNVERTLISCNETLMALQKENNIVI